MGNRSFKEGLTNLDMSQLNHGMAVLEDQSKLNVTLVEVEPEMSPPTSRFTSQVSGEGNHSFEESDRLRTEYFETEGPEDEFSETTNLN